MIAIKIIGHAGEGKSTIAALISKCLLDHGLNVNLIDDNEVGDLDEFAGRTEEEIKACANSISKQNTTINIRTAQARRNEYIAGTK